jgi:hypothetical protein
MARWFVICSVLVLGSASAQVARGAKVSKPPRALGLLELSSDGKAHLIPITILIDGKYYDASAYKAAPVPMALWGDTVYEAIRTGVSQGLFTVTGAMQRRDTNEWMAEGTWQSASAIAAKVPKKSAASEPRGMNDDAGPPVLRHAGADKAKPPEAAAPAAGQSTQTASPSVPASSSPAANSSAGSTPTGPPSTFPSPTASSPTPSSQAASSSTPSPDQSAKTPEETSPDDKNRPVLKRGKPSTGSNEDHTNYAATTKSAQHAPAKPATTALSNPATTASPSSSTANEMQLIPAISDSGGPEPRPYSYSMKSDEEIAFRKKMLAMAADEVRARAGQVAGDSTTVAPPRDKTKATKPTPPDFEDVQLKVFDLASINEPELVLTAKARMPHRSIAKDDASPELQYMVTLVARVDVNGDFHKALANVTDTQHLDVLPRLDLIDAVDVDGDGRGELLFRQVSDAGTAFVVYRVIGDRLYPLFQGVPAGS